jgi:hypothetical protein
MTMDKEKFELPLEYIERVVAAVVKNLKLQGASLTFTSPEGNHFMLSQGKSPPVQLVDENSEVFPLNTDAIDSLKEFDES